MINKNINIYFFTLFSLIPLSILIGPSVSLINLIIIDLSFLIFLFFIKDFSFLKSKALKYLLLFYLYLVFNSIISLNTELGIYRNFGFFRIIIFFVALNYFFNQRLFNDKLILIWFLIISVVVFDIYFEKVNGSNLLGYPVLNSDGESYYGKRIVSFFKDEPIVGGYINAFLLIIVGFLLDKKKKLGKLILFISVILFISIFITGERANSIKACLGLFSFFIFLREFNLKIKILFISTILIFLSIIIYKSDYFKLRYISQIKSSLNNNSIYLNIYKSGFQVFKNYPLFGVGAKNYRYETCENPNQRSEEVTKEYMCTTHPHQIYVEFLSEHGLVGTLILFFLFYKLIFSKIFFLIKHGNYVQLGSLIYLLNVFLPLIPSGAFFNDYSLTLFAINLSILYSSNPNLNIFSKNNGKIKYQ